MTVKEIYEEALTHGHYYLVLLIDFLIYEKKVLHFTDHQEKLEFYLQERFKNKMNGYLQTYEAKRQAYYAQ